MRKFADDFLKVFMFLRNKNNTNYKPCSKKLNSIDNEDLYGMEYRLEDEAVEQVTTYINNLKPLEIPRPENDDSEELYSLPELVSSKITRFLSEFKLHDLYKLLKDNITTLAILISSLGAFIQIFELSSVHVSYLRYFSATQLASDGAVAALILVPLFLGVGVIAQILHHLFEETIEDSNEQLLKSQLFIFIFVGSVSYLCIDFILRGDISLRPISYLAISIGLYFALVGIMALSYRTHKEIINRKYQNKKGILSTKLSSVFMLINFIILFSSVFLLLNKYLEMYRLPYNFDNQKILQKQVMSDYEGIKLKDFELIYFNDRYTLIKIDIPKFGSVIRVYKTDDVLFNPSSVKVYLN